jgi:5-methylcytosine-specific restriction endonuclease McrA
MPRVYCRNCREGFFQEDKENLCSYCEPNRRVCLLCAEEHFGIGKHDGSGNIICGNCRSKFKFKSVQPWLVLRYATFVRDNFTCVYCGRSPLIDKSVKLNCDHIHPRSKGGEDRLENLATACFECNIGKLDICLEENKQEKIRGRQCYELTKRIKELRDNEMENITETKCILADGSYVGEGNLPPEHDTSTTA